MNETVNLHLPQWEATDRIMMDDFNDAMASIDAALAGMASESVKFACGTYTGNGSSSAPNVINLGFRPKAVLIVQVGSSFENGAIFFTQNSPQTFPGSSTTNGEIIENGFQVRQYKYDNSNSTPYTNLEYSTYRYLAIG